MSVSRHLHRWSLPLPPQLACLPPSPAHRPPSGPSLSIPGQCPPFCHPSPHQAITLDCCSALISQGTVRAAPVSARGPVEEGSQPVGGAGAAGCARPPPQAALGGAGGRAGQSPGPRCCAGRYLNLRPAAAGQGQGHQVSWRAEWGAGGRGPAGGGAQQPRGLLGTGRRRNGRPWDL